MYVLSRVHINRVGLVGFLKDALSLSILFSLSSFRRRFKQVVGSFTDQTKKFLFASEPKASPTERKNTEKEAKYCKVADNKMQPQNQVWGQRYEDKFCRLTGQ